MVDDHLCSPIRARPAGTAPPQRAAAQAHIVAKSSPSLHVRFSIL